MSGHTIANLGDATVTFSNGILRLNPHCVVALQGGEAGLTRYSLVYFIRLEKAAITKRTNESGLIPELGKEEVEHGMTAGGWRIIGSTRP